MPDFTRVPILGPLVQPGLTGEDLPDNLFNRYFLNVNVSYRQFIQQHFADGNHAVTLDFEADSSRGFFNDLAIFAKVIGGTIRAAFTLNGDQLEIGKAVEHFAELPIEENAAAIND